MNTFTVQQQPQQLTGVTIMQGDNLTTPPSPDPEECLAQRYWSYFLASSLITFFTGLIAILSYRLIAHFAQFGAAERKRHLQRAEITTTYGGRSSAGGGPGGAGGQAEVKVKCNTRLKWYAESWISGQTVTGRILVSSVMREFSILMSNQTHELIY